MSAAWEGLSDKTQSFISGLTACHSFQQGFRHTLRQEGAFDKYKEIIHAKVPVEHPVVTRHPQSGKKCLFVNSLFTTHIVGMSEHESSSTLRFLYEHLCTPEFTCRFRWQTNSIAFWDNRITQHRPINDFHPRRRRMQRVVIRSS